MKTPISRKEFVDAQVAQGNMSKTQAYELFKRTGGFERSAPEHAVLLLSDTHFGRHTENYTMAKAEERIIAISRSVIRITSILKGGYDIPALHVHLLGDMIQGENSGGKKNFWHLESGFSSVRAQVNKGGEIVESLIRSVGEVFDDVYIDGVAGNHGEDSADRASSPESNRDFSFWDYLRFNIRTAHIHFGQFHSEQVMKQVNGWGHMLKHGDAIGGGGYPNTLRKALADWAIAIPGWKIGNFGHFHNCAVYQVNDWTGFFNGTTVSGDPYGRDKIKQVSPPGCWFYGVHPENGITFMYNLRLT